MFNKTSRGLDEINVMVGIKVLKLFVGIGTGIAKV